VIHEEQRSDYTDRRMMRRPKPYTEMQSRPESVTHSQEVAREKQSITDWLKASNKRKYAKIKLDTFDSWYRVPSVNHKYFIKDTPIILKHRNDDQKTYMSQVIQRATSSVDPRKYSKVVDWKVRSTS
jgi:hypothetical protein